MMKSEWLVLMRKIKLRKNEFAQMRLSDQSNSFIFPAMESSSITAVNTTNPLQENVIGPLIDFGKECVHLMKKCTKPDRKGMFCLCALLMLCAPISSYILQLHCFDSDVLQYSFFLFCCMLVFAN